MKRLLPVVLVLLVSGCVQTGGETKITGAGLAVVDFSSSVEDVEGMGKTVRISMEVENQGGYTTGDVLACLIGSNFPGKISEQMWSSESPVCQSAKRELYAADPETGAPGGTARFRWILKSPWIPYPQERTDEFVGRIFYRYKSQATAKVWVYSEEELRAAKQRGETFSETLETVATPGPVEISLSAKQPIRADDGYFTLTVTLTNSGGGTVFDSKNFDFSSETPPKVSELNVINLRFDYPESSLQDEGCDDVVELRRGETRTISCGFTIKNPETITLKTSFPITVTADYGYYTDSRLEITVRGKKGETP